jgi:hypothetical protein
MFHWASSSIKRRMAWLASLLVCDFLVLAFLLIDSRSASALPIPAGKVYAIPAFARKYGMPCSACHEAWPKLNNFGQSFKDNGYQMGNDRDAPIFQQPAYWPVSFRMTPHWHRESVDRADITNQATGTTVEGRLTTHGFDLSGMDILTAGTLAKNISFLLVPAAGNDAVFAFESANVRFSNLLKSGWLNIKVGKFELDNMISEKRIMTLSANGGYQIYHFQPVTEFTNPATRVPLPFTFGMGDNQIGAELSGHSKNSYTRYSAALLSSNDGSVSVPNGHGYNTNLTFSQAFEAGSLGLQRVGVFAYIGRAPTYQATSSSLTDGFGQKSFYRAGFFGLWYLKKLDFMTMYTRGGDNVFLGTGTPSYSPLPAGAQGPTWNAGFIETHLTVNPQFILVNRYELIRMSRQALPVTPGIFEPGVSVPSANFGDIDALVFGYRYYPFMSSRAGFAIHNEFSTVRQRGGTALLTGGSGKDLTNNSLFIGFDFIF